LTKTEDNTPNSAGRGPAWLVWVLALLPFLVRGLVVLVQGPIYLGQAGYKLAQLGAAVCWRKRFDNRSWIASFWPVDEPRPSAGTWAVAVGSAAAFAASAIASIYLLGDLLGLDVELLRAEFDEKFHLTPVTAVISVLYLFSLNAALEELHFRAWLDRELSARYGDWFGIVVSAVSFSVMHLFIFADMKGITSAMLALLFVALVIAGVVWSLIARRPGGIHAAWLSHGLTDAGLLTWGIWWLGYFEDFAA
jgi:membrane protease YdiL (CAAX protease family)